MSVIRVDNFGPSAGGTTYSADGIAKAWQRCAYSGGSPAIESSQNVSSLTDVGVGELDVNVTNNFTNADYLVLSSARFNAVSGTSFVQTLYGGFSAGAYSQNHFQSGAKADPENMGNAAWGDLA